MVRIGKTTLMSIGENCMGPVLNYSVFTHGWARIVNYSLGGWIRSIGYFDRVEWWIEIGEIARDYGLAVIKFDFCDGIYCRNWR